MHGRAVFLKNGLTICLPDGVHMKKLFHEAAIDPLSLSGEQAATILREFRLDHARYIEALPIDWLKQCQEAIESNPEDPNRHKTLARLANLKSSVLRLRNADHRAVRPAAWKEAVLQLNRSNSFDVMLMDKQAVSSGRGEDLDDYLEKSENNIGAINQTFRKGDDWRVVLGPVLASDNLLVLIDRYFDLDRDGYREGFRQLLSMIDKLQNIAELRIVVAPMSPKDDANADVHRARLKNTCERARALISDLCPEFRARVMVFSAPALHKRYLSTKACGIELDYGLRVGREVQKITVLRAADLELVGKKFTELNRDGKKAWPS